MGSVIAALASYLDARVNGGEWLVRMEDLDPPREVKGAADDILRTLEKLHLEWDGQVLYQSSRSETYREALNQLSSKGLIYRCHCSRLQLAELTIYPGTCRDKALRATEHAALRCRTLTNSFGFTDRLQGFYSQQLDTDVGDFVLLRKDGYFAYQLAVVVDDAWQGISDIVRGYDLLDSTPRQLYLQQLLALPTPRYAHIPLLVDQHGQKLGKQQFSPRADSDQATATLWTALALLQQHPSPELLHENPATLLQWAITHWNAEALKGMTTIVLRA